MVQCTPTIANGRVYVGSGDSRLYALAVESGGQYWFYSTSDAIFAQPLVIGSTVYLASSGQSLSAVDAISGQARWELRTRSPLIFPPQPVGDALLFAASADPTLYAVQRETGRLLWQLDTGDWLAAAPAADRPDTLSVGQGWHVAGLRPVGQASLPDLHQQKQSQARTPGLQPKYQDLRGLTDRAGLFFRSADKP